MIKKYYQLTKPGIIYGNAITAVAGFLLASRGLVNPILLIETILGIALVIASGCVFNNYTDRSIDGKMERTKGRALVTGVISGRNALVYATLLGLIGFCLLISFTNLLTVLIALIGFVFYVVLYGLVKRGSEYGVFVGSVSGAVPPAVGYVAVSNRIDIGAILLFAVLVVWQMPHFYAISIYKMKEYKAAGIPLLPIKKGIEVTKNQMIFYIGTFITTTLLLFTFGYTGYVYFMVLTLVSFSWLLYGIKGLWTDNSDKWAKRMFVFSLVNLLVFSVMISVGI